MTEIIKNYEDLRIWQQAMELAEIVYALCRTLPKEETYGLANQLKRSAISIPSNIAEGSARNGTKELVQFLFIARGSLAELQTQLKLANRLHFFSDVKQPSDLSDILMRGISNLIASLNK